MEYVYLLIGVIAMASQTVLGSAYNKINAEKRGTASLYNLCLIVCALIVYGVLACFSFTFHLPTLWYALGFGVAFAVTQFGMIMSLKTGPLSVTTLILQMSLAGPVIYGFIFWGEKASATDIAGLILCAISLCLCLIKKEENREKKIGPLWILYVALMFIGNAGCSIIQKSQQIAFDGEYKNMFMLFALGVSGLICLIWFCAGDKRDFAVIVRKTSVFPAVAGILNAVMNLIVMYLALRLPSGLVYPVISVGGLILSILASVVFFKEKIRWWQWGGMGLGAVATILLSI